MTNTKIDVHQVRALVRTGDQVRVAHADLAKAKIEAQVQRSGLDLFTLQEIRRDFEWYEDWDSLLGRAEPFDVDPSWFRLSKSKTTELVISKWDFALHVIYHGDLGGMLRAIGTTASSHGLYATCLPRGCETS